jgi:hypothetical protein
VVVGNPGSKRVDLFQAALAHLGLSPARLISYGDLLAGRAALPAVVQPGAVVRIESPGKDFPVERALLAIGAEVEDAEGSFEGITRREAEDLPFERGRIICPRQWYRGFCRALAAIEAQLARCPPHSLMNAPRDIAAMFDKRLCHARMVAAGVAVPPSLGPVTCFDDLCARIYSSGWHRVFVKLAHGSSASGVVAYQTDGRRHHAVTTVEMVQSSAGTRLYNSRRLRLYRDPHDVAALIDALCRHRVHVEAWLPKAGFGACCFDLRVVVIAGRPAHVVARMSHGPMTNLHLLNERGDLETVLARVPPASWDAARETCRRAAACFPASLYAGVDLLLTPNFRRHAVLEINAFGDLLPGVLHDGLDTYAAEVCAVLACPSHGRASPGGEAARAQPVLAGGEAVP